MQLSNAYSNHCEAPRNVGLRVKPQWGSAYYLDAKEVETLCRELPVMFPEHFQVAAETTTTNPGEDGYLVEKRICL